MLFEREFRPIPKREALNVLADVSPYAFQSNELFATGNPKELFKETSLLFVRQLEYYNSV